MFPDGTWSLSVSAPSGYNSASSLVTYQFTDGNQPAATSAALTLRPKGSLAGKVFDSTNTAVGVGGATVSALCTTCAAPKPKLTTVSDSSGNYAFGTAGAPNVFTDGTWTISVAALNGYQASTATTRSFGGDSDDPHQSLDIALAPLGTLTGTVSGVGATTQRLTDVTVTADQCDPADTSDTTCAGSVSAGTELSTQTSDTGVYTFGGTMTPGRWKLATSTTGYGATSKIVHVLAGANTQSTMSARGESPNLAMNAVQVDLPVKVFLNSTTTAIKHAVVTVRRVDGTGTVVQGTLSGSTYVAKGLLPTAYNVTVTGDNSSTGQSVQTTSVTVGIAPTDPDPAHPASDPTHALAPELDITVSLLDFQITGKVLGTTGGGTTAAVPGADVVLLSRAPTTSPAVAGVAALDYQDSAITTTTADGTTGAPAGSFTLTHVANGTYYVSINQPDPTTLSPAGVPSNGFAGTLLGPITVLNGIYSLGTQTLDAVYRAVDVTVNTYADDDLGSVTPTLSLPASSSLGWGDQTGTLSSAKSSATASVYSFTNVPAGCWAFSLAGFDTTTHKGSLTQGTSSGSCPAGSFTVSGAQDSTAGAAAYTIHEHHLAVTSTVTPNGVGTAPNFDLKIGSYDVGNLPASSTATTDYYLPPASYTVKVTPSGATSPRVWPVTVTGSPVDLTSPDQAATVTAVQQALQTMTITQYPGTTSTRQPTYTVTCTGTDCANISSYLPSPITDDGTHPTTAVTGLPPGKYTVTATSTNNKPVPGGTDSNTVTLTNGGTNTLTWGP